MGNESVAEHSALIDLISKYSWKNVVLVGGDFNKIAHGYLYFDNVLKAKEWVRQQQFKDSMFLVKGSRSLQMEKVFQ